MYISFFIFWASLEVKIHAQGVDPGPRGAAAVDAALADLRIHARVLGDDEQVVGRQGEAQAGASEDLREGVADVDVVDLEEGRIVQEVVGVALGDHVGIGPAGPVHDLAVVVQVAVVDPVVGHGGIVLMVIPECPVTGGTMGVEAEVPVLVIVLHAKSVEEGGKRALVSS